jgi:hypothetical protein
MISVETDTSRCESPQSTSTATADTFSVSGLLAEATSDPMFLQAAQESTEFIHAHLYSIQNIVQDSISASASDLCAVGSPIIKPYNSGLMIEALAVLASITQNSTTQAL